MARLLKQLSDDILLAKEWVRAPAYTAVVANTTPTTVLPDNWRYTPEDVEAQDLIYPWRQPTGAQDAYALSAEVLYADKRWTSLIDANVWAPGVSGWREIPMTGENPAWAQPTGAHDAYALNYIVSHVGKIWRSDREANVWEPGTFDAGWTATIQIVPPPPVTATWVDTGATIIAQAGTAYQLSTTLTGLTVKQPLRLGPTAETKFNGYWPSIGTPSAYITLAPFIQVAVGSKVWKWA